MTPDSAVLVAIVSAFCFAVAEMFTRNALRFSTPITASILSIAGQFILLTFLIALTGKFSSLHWEGVLWFLLAGFMNPFLFVAFYFVGIQRIGVARSAPIKGTAPIYAVIFAAGVLGERFSGVQYLGIAMVVGGIIFISAEGWAGERRAGSDEPEGGSAGGEGGSGPATGRTRKLDFLFPLLAGVSGGVASVLFKLSMQKLPSPMVGVWLGTVVALILFPILAFFFPKEQRYRASRRAYPWLIGNGIAISAAMYTLILSVGLGEVAIAFTLVQTSPLLVIGMSAIFLRKLERVTPRIIFGAILTVSGGVLVSLL
ncbi:MAG: DMT family transporter [Nitrospinota bacterium]|jgi:drug/metabolite transporter (DMT)-like permease|nr:DMT family transporter [Nitrospinota bacterium]